MVISQDEICSNHILEEINRSKKRILLSLVEKEFKTKLGVKYTIVKETCEHARNMKISEDRMEKILEKTYRYKHEEQRRRLLEISKRVVKLTEGGGVDHIEVYSALFDLIIIKPMDVYEEIKEKYDFEIRDDNWLEKEYWLKSKLGPKLFYNLKNDGPIISQAITVKEMTYKERHVVMITTDTGWVLVRYKLSGVKSFGFIIFKRKKLKGDGDCVRL